MDEMDTKVTVVGGGGEVMFLFPWNRKITDRYLSAFRRRTRRASSAAAGVEWCHDLPFVAKPGGT